MVDPRDGGANLGSPMDAEGDVEYSDSDEDGDDTGGGGEDEEDEDESGEVREPVTDGGGSSRAGLSGGGRGAEGAGSARGGGATKSPNAGTSTKGKGKGKGSAPRHAKKGTHQHIDEEEAELKTTSRAVPPGKRQTSWAPPDKSNSVQGLLEKEHKMKEKKMDLLERFVVSRTGGNSGNAGAQANAQKLDQVTKLAELGIFSRGEARKMVTKLAPELAELMDDDSGKADDFEDLLGEG